LGLFYATVQKMPEAERLYLRALDIYERLAKTNPVQFEPDLARTAMNLGLLLFDNGRIAEAENNVRRANDIFRRVAEGNHAQFDLSVSRTCAILGLFKKNKGETAAAKALFEESIAIASRYPDVPEAQQLINLAKKQME
jgi:tetratricopeptide (TPR) repeat protein